jgi:glycosyltransferase involved in cell wall biosynthesis
MTIAASIIIPTYNHVEFLPDAIKSAMTQSVTCEIIVVDDGSTDGTAEFVHQFASVRYFRTEHLGPCNARNVGLDAATAEYVMFLDADDMIHQRKVETQLREMLPDVGWVLCDVQIENEATRSTTFASVQYDYKNGFSRSYSMAISYQSCRRSYAVPQRTASASRRS